MDYTSGSSGAQIGEVPGAMINFFGMGSTARHITSAADDVEWDRLVYTELAAGRPVYVGGYTGDWKTGHAFVADGYDGNRRYHINWGWGGNSDGYYLLTNLTPGKQGIGGSDDGSGFTTGLNIVVGIEPVNYATRAMNFADAMVRSLCIANWDADGDGAVTYGEAAAVTTLGDVFKGQRIKSFQELYYFTGLTNLDANAFSGCAQLASIRLPKGLKTIGEGSFSGCTSLKSLELPDGLTAIGSSAFSGCRLLSALELPTGLTTIARQTFQGCERLSEVVLPIGITAIGERAFSDCSGLTSFVVKTFSPSSVTLGEAVFENTPVAGATLSVMQSTRQWFLAADQWKDFGTISEERELSAGQFVALEAGKTYYLYNIGTGKYVTQGEAWGTQATVGTSPLQLRVRAVPLQPDGTYYLTVATTTGKVFRTSTDNNIGKGVPAVFVDGQSITDNCYWTIAPVADSPYGDHVYTIQIPKGKSGYKEGCYWGVQTDHASNAAQPTYGVYSDVDYEAHTAGCLWRFVAYDEKTTRQFQQVNILSNLLTMGKTRRLNTVRERAVYDNLASDSTDIRRAQRSLRQRMELADFGDLTAHSKFVDLGDISSDAELSQNEASVLKELPVSFINDQTLTDVEALRHFTSLTTIPANIFSGCKALERAWLPASVTTVNANSFRSCTALKRLTLSATDPSAISVAGTAFSGVDLSACTLRVPFGTGAAYSAAATWKDFGRIEEVRLDGPGAVLGTLLENAGLAGVDASTEQAVYADSGSSDEALLAAVATLKRKLHYLDFADEQARSLSVENWDSNFDGYLSEEEAAAVTTLGEVFRESSDIRSLEELRHFTGLKEISANAFRNMKNLQTVYLPESVSQIGEYAFLSADNLKYIVLLNAGAKVPQQMLGLPQKGVTLFVPQTMVESYKADAQWASQATVTAYTGKPVVTATGTRVYGDDAATLQLSVSGAPIVGTPLLTCEANSDSKAAAGTYAISVERGTITDEQVELHDGVLTIERYPLTVTAVSCTRNVGEENPVFTFTHERLPNRESDAKAFQQLPVLSCEATADSPAGEYAITISGGEARNYELTYVPGVLTVVDPTGVAAIKATQEQGDYYDLQGRRVTTPQRGIFIRNGKKVIR
jgi:hypothetical protein